MKCEDCNGTGESSKAGKPCFICDGSGELCDVCGEASEPGQNVCEECDSEQGS